MTSDTVEVKKLHNADLTSNSEPFDAALNELTFNGKEKLKNPILIVGEADAVVAGRLAEKHSINQVICLPYWAIKRDAWILVDGYRAAGSEGA